MKKYYKWNAAAQNDNFNKAMLLFWPHMFIKTLSFFLEVELEWNVTAISTNWLSSGLSGDPSSKKKHNHPEACYFFLSNAVVEHTRKHQQMFHATKNVKEANGANNN